MLSYLVLKYATAFSMFSSQPQSQFFIEDDDDCEEEEELLFCKNNVFVPDTKSEQGETPGYFILKCRTRLSGRKRLIISWTPNSHLVHRNETQPTTTVSAQSERQQQPQKVFNVDLSEMKSLNLFYDDEKRTSGQFVVGNYENHYKVFNFPVGGLEKITQILETWEWCVSQKVNQDENRKRCFLVTLRTPVNKDCYVEEGRYNPMSYDAWKTLLNDKGQIEDVANFRRAVFFGGLSPEVRKEAWKFLLFYYTFDSTHQERAQLKAAKELEYLQIHRKRLSMSEQEHQVFWKAVQCTVDKDVPRTDRTHPYFAGNDNPNTEVMRNILLNYGVHNPLVGYNQGMSDLLAPVLAVVQDEVDAFWCFAGLMEASVFVTSPKDDIMDRQLRYLRELTRMLEPKFYAHLLIKDEGMDMLFCHRWLLLCFKREFFSAEVLLMWEACWSRYQTEYFHIFLCVAMVQEYGHEVIEKDMQVDEMLQYFTDLSLKMDGSLVLRKARQLLLKFRQLPYIPCCVRGLLSGPGVWDSAPLPVIECQCHGKCAYDEVTNQEVMSTDMKCGDDEREKYQDELPEKTLVTREEAEKREQKQQEEKARKVIPEEEKNKKDNEIIEREEFKSKETNEITSEEKSEEKAKTIYVGEQNNEETVKIIPQKKNEGTDLQDENNKESSVREIIPEEEKNGEACRTCEINGNQEDNNEKTDEHFPDEETPSLRERVDNQEGLSTENKAN